MRIEREDWINVLLMLTLLFLFLVSLYSHG